MAYTPEQLEQIAKAAAMLDRMDYYQVLKLQVGASPKEIKLAFFRQSKTWHPDRFFRRVPEKTYRDVMNVYKRISEAYAILRDPQVKRVYDQRITGPNRAQHLRYDRVKEEQAERAKKDEDIARTDMGRKYAKMAFQAMKGRNFAGAEINFKLAIAAEPDNAPLKAAYLKHRRDNMKQSLSEEDREFLARHGG